MSIETTEIKVRGYHLDINGHVNNARYLEFIEEGRWAWSEKNMDFVFLKQRGLLFSVVNINIDYKRGAYVNEILEVKTSLESLGETSGILRQKIILKGTDKTVADCRVTFVLIDESSKKPVKLEGELREQLGAFMG